MLSQANGTYLALGEGRVGFHEIDEIFAFSEVQTASGISMDEFPDASVFINDCFKR
jgi:hypothetical protein